jgi:trehalose synthase
MMGPTGPGDVAPLVDAMDLGALQDRARPLSGMRILHLSASPLMSAVAETLRALVPLQRALGLRADWQLVGDLPESCTELYEGMRGDAVRWRPAQSTAWHQLGGMSAWIVPPGYDVIVVHDPQLVVLHTASPGNARARWVWHCHLDPTGASPELWNDVRHALEGYTAALFPSIEMIPRELPVPQVAVVPPGLDPGSARNRPLPDAVVRASVLGLGMDPDRPLLGQFSPIDARFAPMAALGTYWLVRRHMPDVQIVLAEGVVAPARRRPGGWEQVEQAARADPDIHLLPADAELRAQDSNALQRACTVALQMAVPRGFGWGIAECQWKRKPVVVGTSGELPEQVSTGSGYVVGGAPFAAERVMEVLARPDLAAELGGRGHRFIERHHLTTRLAKDYVELLHSLVAASVTRGEPIGSATS